MQFVYGSQSLGKRIGGLESSRLVSGKAFKGFAQELRKFGVLMRNLIDALHSEVADDSINDTRYIKRLVIANHFFE